MAPSSRPTPSGSWLPALRPGQVVVLDNLSAHKSADARTAVEAVGCRLLFLPAYSPDFNPIELAFAKVKQRLRAAAERTPDGLVAATASRHRRRLRRRRPRLLCPLRLPPPGRLI